MSAWANECVADMKSAERRAPSAEVAGRQSIDVEVRQTLQWLRAGEHRAEKLAESRRAAERSDYWAPERMIADTCV
jgi:hypothetical protein